MPRRLPAIAVLLGVAGLAPFVATALAATSTADLERAARYAGALIGYGAVILAFLGGVHWGFALAPLPAAPATHERIGYRLCLGVTPALVGWAALIVLLFGLLDVALAILVAGLVAFTLAEAELRRRGLVPAGYMLLRWSLSAAVAVILLVVLVVRLVGGTLTF